MMLVVPATDNVKLQRINHLLRLSYGKYHFANTIVITLLLLLIVIALLVMAWKVDRPVLVQVNGFLILL